MKNKTDYFIDFRNLIILIGLVMLITFLSTCTVMYINKSDDVRIDHESDIQVDSVTLHSTKKSKQGRSSLKPSASNPPTQPVAQPSGVSQQPPH